MVGGAYAQSNLPACLGSDVSRWSNCVGSNTSFFGNNKYVGEYKDGKPNGQGTLTFTSGLKIVGEYKDGMPNGQVTINYADGSKYAGEHKDGKLNGQGTYTFASGEKYVGEFMGNKRNGQGTHYSSSGLIINQGIFADDKFVPSAPVRQATAPNAEIEKLRSEAEEPKRKQAELEAQLRVAQPTAQTSVAIESAQFLGLFVADLTDDQKSALKIKGGVRVEALQEPAAKAGLREGDVILAIRNVEVAQAKDFAAVIAKMDKTKPVSVLFKRNDTTRFALIRPSQSGDADAGRNLADQKAKEEQRLAEEARNKEQQRLAIEVTETNRLRAEFEESKRSSTELENQRLKTQAEDAQRKLAELEAQLKLAKQQPQVASPTVMTTMANRKALVIGNDTYKSVTKLLNAREDAKAIASSLATVGYQVTLKLDLNEKELKAVLRNFSSQVQGGDEVMFFFAGHGIQLGAANYLLPIDIGSESEAQVKDEAIQLQRILDDMTEKKAKFTLAMIDACRDNPFKTNGRAIGGRGLAPTTAATGQMIVFSAGTGQQALDKLGSNDKNKNGVFTRIFLKEMQKPGVSIDRIIKNVREEVADLANTVGHEQVPAIYDQVRGDFYFKK